MAEENLEPGGSSGPPHSILPGPRYPFSSRVIIREIIPFVTMNKIRLRSLGANIMQQVIVLIP